MKKFFIFLSAGLLMTACSDDVNAPANGEGNEQEVTLTFELPDAIASRATGGSNSALGGASNCEGEITFTAALYKDGKLVWNDDASAVIPNANASVTFRPTLIIGEDYELVAYAQLDGIVTDLTNVTETNAINDETVDAYFVSTTVKAEASMSATLKRATGKLRIIAEDAATAEAQLDSKIASIQVVYKQAQPTVFNPTTGAWATEATEVDFNNDVTVYSNETDARTLLVDYIPATETGEIINVEKVVVTFEDGTVFTKGLSTIDVPVKRNYLTTLRGNFFTDDMELRLEIDDAFEGENEVENFELLSAFENGGYLTLSEDVVLDETLVLKAGKSLVLNLNGKTITNKVDNALTDVIVVEEGATLTINGDGAVTAVSGNDGYAVISAGKLIINGGEYTSGLDTQNDGNATIYARGNGEIYINGGKFQNSGDPTAYVINKKDGDRATTTIVIKGGTFVNFNPANNAAEGSGTNFVAEGYSSYEKEANVWEVIEGVAATDVATLAAAVAAGGNITVVSDIVVDQKIEVAAGKNAVIEIAEGASLTVTDVVNAPIANYGNLTVKGGIIKSVNTEAGRRCIYNYAGGEMVIDGVTFEQTYGRKGAAINNEGKMTIKNATVDAVYYSIWNSGANAEMTIESGSYTTTNDVTIKDTWSYCVNNQNGAKLTINGGTFTGNHGVIGATSGAETILNAGTFHCTAEYSGNSDWTLYANNATITYNAANCTITSNNTSGVSATEGTGAIIAK